MKGKKWERKRKLNEKNEFPLSLEDGIGLDGAGKLGREGVMAKWEARACFCGLRCSLLVAVVCARF